MGILVSTWRCLQSTEILACRNFSVHLLGTPPSSVSKSLLPQTQVRSSRFLYNRSPPALFDSSDSILHWSLRVLCLYSEEAGGIVGKPSLDVAHITSAHLPLDKDPTRENTQPYVDAGSTGRCSGWLETLLPVPTSSCGSREPNLWRTFYPHLVFLDGHLPPLKN